VTISALEIAARVRAGLVSAREVAHDTLARIDRQNPVINAFTQVFHERALAAAKDVDARIARGEHGALPLAGVPIAIKDNLCVGPDLHTPGDGLGYGGFTTCASRMLEHYRSPFSATCVERLIRAGAIVVGKTNLDEFAMGSSTENSIFGPTRNPWDLDRVPGGSSGGSAAAVAARLCPLALGSDTGGSIRQPASHCGVVGIKPTYGRVSRWGLVAYASSLDQIGPFANTVADAAACLHAICGLDPLDSTSSDHPIPAWVAELDTPVDGLRIGVPRQAKAAANHPGVASAYDAMLRVFQNAGASLIDIDLPLTEYGIAAYYIVAPAEASSNLARFDGIRYGRRAELTPGEDLFDLYCRSRSEGFSAEVKRRIMLGTHVLSSGYYDAFYTTALKARRRILDDYRAAFNTCHVIAMPASPGPAFRIGEKTADPLAMYLEDVYTVGVNLAGLPGMTVPAGFAQVEGRDLPVGVQIIAPAFEEATMFRAARVIERALNLCGRTPPTAPEPAAR